VINLTSVQAVEIRRDGRSLLALAGDSARGFLRLVDFAHPVQIDGVLGAIVTGELIITTTDSREVKFLVYNNRLIVREGVPPTYYACSESFAHALTVGIR
jgi:hypothetical protein